MFRNSVDTVKYNYIIVYTSTGYFSKFHREIVFVCSNYTIFIERDIYIYILMNVDIRNTVNHKLKHLIPLLMLLNITSNIMLPI